MSDAAGPSFIEALRAKIGEASGPVGEAPAAGLAVLLVECGVIGRIDAIWGFHIGDAVRGRAAALMRAEVLREGDLVAEIGRDDLACVLSGIGDPALAVLAAEKSLRALNAPFWIGDHEVFASPAIGIALCPAHGDEAESLLQRSKSACAAARELPGRIAEYGQGDGGAAEARFLQENRLRTAVVEDALEMVFQPQYDLRLGQIMGAQSLLRWPGAGAQTVPARQLFAAAESTGSVAALAGSILNRALRNVSEFRYSAGLDLRVSVELPARALLIAELPDVVQRSLGTWGLRAGRLNLEIGETAVLREHPLARETLARLKAVGVKLSISDPDLALSALFWLATLPFQELKIDVSSTGDPAAAPKSARILQSFIELAHHLRLDVVAFGVPDEAAAERLKELDCNTMQADFRGPALDPKAFVARYGFSDG